ncbi:hypothetical protein J5N97_022603 [Dioscorea zingiberensis]|uniref:FAF domain-containing protein n=1 Tax=Dioscorea zingiberensis TaxID=325984 RepID=A0A9D5CAF6_9LILI|nr:hypothetical protein J5N97_022603 [Dioscorea zingiberensis]
MIDGGKAPLDPPPTELGSDPLQLCTEGLGFESTGDVEDLRKESWDEYWSGCRNGAGERRSADRYSRRSGGKGFPPLISTMGRSGKPLVHLESYRNDGRFILKEDMVAIDKINVAQKY